MEVTEKSGYLSISCPNCKSIQYVTFSAKKEGLNFQVLHCSPQNCHCGYSLALIIEGMI
jgi:hypothetical protein